MLLWIRNVFFYMRLIVSGNHPTIFYLPSLQFWRPTSLCSIFFVRVLRCDDEWPLSFLSVSGRTHETQYTSSTTKASTKAFTKALYETLVVPSHQLSQRKKESSIVYILGSLDLYVIYDIQEAGAHYNQRRSAVPYVCNMRWLLVRLSDGWYAHFSVITRLTEQVNYKQVRLWLIITPSQKAHTVCRFFATAVDTVKVDGLPSFWQSQNNNFNIVNRPAVHSMHSLICWKYDCYLVFNTYANRIHIFNNLGN